MRAYLKVANLDMNMQGEVDFSNPNIALYYTDNFRKSGLFRYFYIFISLPTSS